MFVFEEYLNVLSFLKEAQVELDESGIGQFISKIHKGIPCAILSAERDENGKKRNKERTEALKKYILDKGFGYMPIKGGFVETNKDTGEEKMIDGEQSFVIYADKDREKELRKTAMGLGKFFKQESILFRDSKGKANWIITTPNKDNGEKFGDEHHLGDFHPKRVGQYYSKLKDKHKISYASTKFDPKTMDKCYYVSYKKTGDDKTFKSVGRNTEGRLKMQEILRKHPGIRTQVKALWKDNNQEVDGLQINS